MWRRVTRRPALVRALTTTVVRARVPAGSRTRTPPPALRATTRRPLTVALIPRTPAGRRTRTHCARQRGGTEVEDAGLVGSGASAHGMAVSDLR
jgi:hypothetical protein